jgi:septum site-determining protein MinC
MPTSKASKTVNSFDIKSALLPLESVIIRTDDMKIVEKDLDARFAKHPDFFDNDPVMIDLTQIQESASSAALDLPKLCQVLRKYKMNPVALRSNNKTHHAWAELSGLFLITASQMPLENKRGSVSASESTQIGDSSLAAPIESSPASTNFVRTAQETSKDLEDTELEVPLTSALIVDKPLRSGQHVYAKGRDLVVMAMVNAGAEIMADGHIHVYAPLRGKAIAGARGNKDARIYTSCLEAELVSIAGVYRTSDKPIPKEVAGKSAQIRLIDDKLVMQPQ